MYTGIEETIEASCVKAKGGYPHRLLNNALDLGQYLHSVFSIERLALP